MAATLSTTDLNLIFDAIEPIAAKTLAAYGQRVNSDPIVGYAASGIALDQLDLEKDFLLGVADLELSNALGPSIFQMRGQSRPEVVIANYCTDILSRVGQVIQSMQIGSNVISLDSFLSYYNFGAGGTNTALQSPFIRWIMESVGMPLTRGNFCYVANSTGLHVGSATGGVFTAGTRTVDTTKFVGGRPVAKLVTHALDNAVITVTGECWDPATQSILTGRTWVSTGGDFTAALEERSLISGGGTPAPANALLTKATAIAGVGAGNRIDIRLYAPAGRTFTEWIV